MDPFLSDSKLNSEKSLIELGTGSDFVSASANSLVVILVTEIGDKTFFIAAVLAMRSGRLIVYLGAMGALAVMHVMSSFMGFALPALLPHVYTHYASAVSRIIIISKKNILHLPMYIFFHICVDFVCLFWN